MVISTKSIKSVYYQIFRPMFKYKKETFYLGSFANEIDAVKAYNEMVKKYYPNDYERIWNKL
jgi:hypothetical protein